MAGKFAQGRESEPVQEPRIPVMRRVLDVMKTILVYTVMALSMGMMIFTAISMITVNRNDRDIFGFKAFIVRSDSMSATDFSAGDLVVIREVGPNTLLPGDIISFRSEDPATLGETFTHKIREITTTDDGWPAFITYGTTTGVDDAFPVRFGSVLGKYLFRIPNMGTIFSFMKTTPGYICCIGIPVLLMLLIQGGNSLNLVRQMYQQKQDEAVAQSQSQVDELAAIVAHQQKLLDAQRRDMQKLFAEVRRQRAILEQLTRNQS